MRARAGDVAAEFPELRCRPLVAMEQVVEVERVQLARVVALKAVARPFQQLRELRLVARSRRVRDRPCYVPSSSQRLPESHEARCRQIQHGVDGIAGLATRQSARRVRPTSHYRGVPTISRFYGIVIAMFFDDHGYPHFHARHAEGEAKVRIDSLEVMDSSLPRRQLRFVLAWAELHQEELNENWRRARAGETLTEIEPLR